MKQISILVAVIYSAFLACTPTSESEVVVENLNPVTYEIFVQSFSDSNGDGIGDINGMTSRLDYLADLGIGAVWLMPINPSPSYHKYDVTDYYDIHPDYGTLDDFKKFVSEAHKRNIKIVMDMVINHSSSEHPIFKSSAAGEDLYRDFYVWAYKDSVAAELDKQETSFDSGNIRQWHAYEGDTTKKHYYGFFTGRMPDLNFDYAPVRDEVITIANFWLTDIGVDGFRLDAAKHIYPDERVQDNADFWKDYLSKLREIDPDVYTVGEVWANADFVSEFVGGFTGLFNFDLAFSILESVNREKLITASIAGHSWKVDEGSFVEILQTNRERYIGINPSYEDAIFLTNHDQNRYMNVLGGDRGKAELAFNMLMTLPGRPYLYYGEEIGMFGEKPDPNIREPFLWDDAANDTERATWIDPKFSTDQTVIPLSQQLTDPNSMYSHHSSWIKLRNQNPALHSGNIRAIKQDNQAIASWYRTYGEETVLVIHNLSAETQKVGIQDVEFDEKLFGEGTITEQEASLPPRSSLIVR